MAVQNLKRHIPPVFLLLILVLACAEQNEVFYYDPSIKAKFINVDSLVKTTDSLDVTNDSIVVLNDTIGYLNDSLRVLGDSLIILNDSIDGGKNEYIPIRDKLLGVEAEFTGYLSIVEENSTLLSTIKKQLSLTVTTINSGELLVSSIENLESGASFAYSDSTILYNLPLSMNSDISKLSIEIDGYFYDIELGYDREEIVDEKRRIRISISNVEIINNNFDSVSCKTLNCENETPVKFYF